MAQQSIPASVYTPAKKLSRDALNPSTHWQMLRLGLITVDAAALGAAIAIAYLIRFKTGIPFLETPPHSLAFYSSVAYWVVPVWLAIFGLYRLYDRQYLFSGFQEYIRVINGCTVGVLAVIVVSFLDETLSISRGWLLMVWFLSILSVGSSRFVLRRVVRRLRSKGFLATPTVIVGANGEGQALAEQFLADPGSGISVVGFVDETLPFGSKVAGQLAVLGRLGDLEDVIRDQGVSEVVVSTTALPREQLIDLYQRLGRFDGVTIRLSSGLFEILTTGVRVQEISCVPLMTPQRVRITGVDAALKTVLDYIGAFMGLLLLSPLLLAVALLVRLDSPGPVFHRRRVLGREGKPFDAFKFRTMVADADRLLASNPDLRAAFESGFKLKDDPRVTRIGRLLRRTSLDELPQLFNVLRGEMSLVGPRMIAPDEALRYGKWQLNLLTVKPGITGPWQIRGRNDIPYDERVRLSMHYIRNYTIWLDLEILLRTVPAVLRAKGAY
ncbi:MAG: sugar transferase [Chloroflexota bacterium]|jgi:exopolysaccharide biosynthesis polyprenyl glycosylphosphotransferase